MVPEWQLIILLRVEAGPVDHSQDVDSLTTLGGQYRCGPRTVKSQLLAPMAHAATLGPGAMSVISMPERNGISWRFKMCASLREQKSCCM